MDLVRSRGSDGTQIFKSRCGSLCVDECVDRKSTRLNSSHSQISYAVFCLKQNIAVVELVAMTFAEQHPGTIKAREIRIPFGNTLPHATQKARLAADHANQ